MSFNTEELYVLRSHLALGQTPTQADLEAAAEFSNIRAFARDLVAGNTQSNEDFVSSLYENLLDRTPAAEEVQWWAEQMDQGLRSLTKAQILLAFQDAAASEEGGVANAKVEALGLESIDLEFGSTGPGEPGEPTQPVEFNVDLGEVSSVTNNTWSIGREAVDAGQATLSSQYTIALKNQLNTPRDSDDSDGVDNIETYNAYFISPLLSNVQSSTTQSELVIEVIDRHAETSADALKFMAIQSFNFFFNGENIVVSSEAILNASTYEELRAAIEAALVADGRGDEFTVRLGSDFERQQTDPNTQEFTGGRLVGQQIVIEAKTDGEIVRGGFETGAKPNAQQNIDVAARMDDSAETTVTTTLISTNLELQNVGYGSQGARLNVSGQSHSDKAIQEFKIDAQAHSLGGLGVWLTSLSSNPYRDNDQEGLERIELRGTAPYFYVGKQEGEKVVADDKAGLVDVREFAAGNFGGNIQLDATITSDIIARDFDLVDTDGNAARDNVPAEYDLGRGDDRLLMEVAVEALAHEDFALNINTGAGNDYVHLKLSGDLTGNQFENHVDRDNIKITATSGNNTIWTEGAGKVNVITGGGNDTIYTDNSGSQTIGADEYKAHWVLNADDTNVQDLRGNEASTALLTGAKVQVTFADSKAPNAAALTNGFESKLIDIPVNAQGQAGQAQVNQAIKKAINEDAVLSKLLIAKDGPHNTLIIESLIDGEFAATDLNVTIVPGSTTATDPNFIGNNAVTQLGNQLKGSSTDNALTPAEVQARLDAGAAAMQPNYNSAQGTVGSATAPVTGTAATAVLDISGLTFDGTAVHEITGDLTLGGTAYANAADLATALEGLADVASAVVNGAGTGIDIEFVVQDAAGANPGFAFDVVEDTDADGTPDVTEGATVTAGTTGSAGGGAGVAIEGANSDAESFVTVNAGAGQDVIVLSTSANAADKVVFEGSFGHNTIVNFGANNSSDTLDFTSYLNTQVRTSTSGEARSSTTADYTFNSTGTATANSISVLSFTTAGNESSWSDASFANKLLAALNGGDAFGGIANVLNSDNDNFGTAQGEYSSSTADYLVLVENAQNRGEYKVVKLTAVSDDAANVDTGAFASAQVVGTVDFGHEVTFGAAVLEGVA